MRRFLLFRPRSEKERPLESRLRPTSAVRLWLTRRREHPETATAQDLLAALTDPKADWADRAAGYPALGEIELSEAERNHANQILCQGLGGFRRDLPTRLGASVVPLGAVSLLLLFLSIDLHKFYLSVPLLVGMGVGPWLLFVFQERRERLRSGSAQQAAAAALAQIGDPPCLLILSPLLRQRRSPLREAGIQAIHAILPQITPDCYRQLPGDVEQALLQLVLSPHEEVALAALDAVERLNDGRYAVTLYGMLANVRSANVRARGDAVLSLLRQHKEPDTPPISLVNAFFERPSNEHPLRRWLSQHGATRSGSAAALLSALSMPAGSAEDRAQGFRALCSVSLSPSEQMQANQLMVETLQLTGASTTLNRRIRRAGAQGLLLGMGLGTLGFVISTSVLFFGPDRPTNLESLLTNLSEQLVITICVMVLFTVLTGPLFFLALTLLEPKNLLKERDGAVFCAGQIGGPECIIPLSGHVIHATSLRQEALNALQKILPRVTEAWYGRLPAGVIPVLLKMTGSTNEPLACLAIDAIGRAGGGNCLEQIALVAQRSPSAEARAHAAAVLPILQERRDRESSAATLLRASQATSTDHLLKPVYAVEVDTSNLLRASQGGRQDPQDDPPK